MPPSSNPLWRLVCPRSVAVVGGAAAEEVIRQCRRIGFEGPIWPVNRQRKSLGGLTAYASVVDLPGVPDAAFVAVPCRETVAVVSDLARRGAGGAVCYASGFAEAGPEGRRLQEELVAASGRMPLIGPNCYGILNYLDGCALWPDLHGGKRQERGVALIAQSGNVALNLTLQRRFLPISHVVALGNQAKTRIDQCLELILEDERVTAVGLVIEGLSDVAAFANTAAQARARGKSIVALKLGRSAIGAELAASHTRSLVGSDRLYRSLFKRLGVAVCDDLETFVETLKLLHVAGPLPGRRVVAAGCSGGDALMVADLGSAAGLSFPAFEPKSIEDLRTALGPEIPLHNPLDYQTYIWEDQAALTTCFNALGQTSADVCLLVLDTPVAEGRALPGWDQVTAAYLEARARRPQLADQPASILVSSLPELMPEGTAAAMMAAGIAPLQGLRPAIAAIGNAADIGAGGALASMTPVPPLLLDGLGGRTTVVLGEAEGKEALARFGVPVPTGRRVRGATAALAAAEAIGWPVVLKSALEGLTHKSDRGGVRLDLGTPAALADAARDLAALSEEFLVETMAERVLAELLVGVTRDDQFGLALTLGAGGVLVELLDDTVTLLLPVTRTEIRAALGSLKVARLLSGFRGRAVADAEQLLDAVEAIARYALAHADRLVELDVNPLLITEAGPVAVDVLIRLAEARPASG